MTKTQKDNAIRERELKRLMEFYESFGFSPMKTAGGTFYVSIPALEEADESVWLKVSAIIPKASEEDGTDGYSLAEEYTMKEEEKAEKARAKAEEKAKKIAKAQAEKERKAKAKTE